MGIANIKHDLARLNKNVKQIANKAVPQPVRQKMTETKDSFVSTINNATASPKVQSAKQKIASGIDAFNNNPNVQKEKQAVSDTAKATVEKIGNGINAINNNEHVVKAKQAVSDMASNLKDNVEGAMQSPKVQQIKQKGENIINKADEIIQDNVDKAKKIIKKDAPTPAPAPQADSSTTKKAANGLLQTIKNHKGITAAIAAVALLAGGIIGKNIIKQQQEQNQQ